MKSLVYGFTRIGIGIVLMYGATAPLLAQGSPLDRWVGVWTEDESKRKDHGQLIFQRDAKGGVEEVRGGEASPTIQPVIFDGKPRQTVTGNTYLWKQADSRTFERTLTNKEGLVTTRRLRLSADGKTLTEEAEFKEVDAIVTTTTTYQRASGDASGLVGRWELQSSKSSRPERVRYERAGTNALKVSSDSVGVTFTVAFDNKPVVVTGPFTIKGTTIAGKLVNERTIELTYARDGTVINRSTEVLSADGKIITATDFDAGPNARKEPTVRVYVRQ